MTPELKTIMEVASRTASRLFLRRGELTPMYHIVRSNGEHLITPAPPTDKDTAVALMRLAMRTLEARAYVFMDEAWMKDRVPEADLARIHRDGVKHEPGRIEVLYFIGEDNEGMVTAMRPIKRGNKLELGELEYLSSGEHEGRMVGLLPRPKDRMLS